MAEIATVARRYAEALFRAALDANALGAVAESLALAAAIEKDETMRAVLLNPKVSATQKKQVFEAAAGGRLHPTMASALDLLVDRHREVLIGSIAE